MGDGETEGGGIGVWVSEDKAEIPARAGAFRAWWAGFGGLLPTEDTRELPSESGSHGWGTHISPFSPPLFWLQSFCG